jgi:hypothetical protein
MTELIEPTVTVKDIGGQEARFTASAGLTEALHSDAAGQLESELAQLSDIEHVRALTWEGLSELLDSLASATNAATVLKATTVRDDEKGDGDAT